MKINEATAIMILNMSNTRDIVLAKPVEERNPSPPAIP